MAQTSAILIILVVLGLAYTRGCVTGTKKPAKSLLDMKAYMVLLIAAVVLAIFWYQ